MFLYLGYSKGPSQKSLMPQRTNLDLSGGRVSVFGSISFFKCNCTCKDRNKKRKRRSEVRPKIAQVKTANCKDRGEVFFFCRIPLLDDLSENISLDAGSEEPLRRSVQVKGERKLTVAEEIFERRRVLAESVFENC